jgi:hypothetical protein
VLVFESAGWDQVGVLPPFLGGVFPLRFSSPGLAVGRSGGQSAFLGFVPLREVGDDLVVGCGAQPAIPHQGAVGEDAVISFLQVAPVLAVPLWSGWVNELLGLIEVAGSWVPASVVCISLMVSAVRVSLSGAGWVRSASGWRVFAGAVVPVFPGHGSELQRSCCLGGSNLCLVITPLLQDDGTSKKNADTKTTKFRGNFMGNTNGQGRRHMVPQHVMTLLKRTQ